jgi:hypothetical protein
MTQTKYQKYITNNVEETNLKLEDFIVEHAKALRHVYTRLSRFSQRDIDTRIQMAFSSDQPSDIRGMTAFEIICWCEVFNCYSLGDYYLNLEALYKICDENHSARYMRAVYVSRNPDEVTYNLLRASHPQSAKAYLEYCKYVSAMLAKNKTPQSVFLPVM